MFLLYIFNLFVLTPLVMVDSIIEYSEPVVGLAGEIRRYGGLFSIWFKHFSRLCLELDSPGS